MKAIPRLALAAALSLCALPAFAQKHESMVAMQKAVKLMEEDKKYDQAIKVLKDALKNDPNELNLHYELAFAYNLNKDYSKAAKQLEDIIEEPKVNAQFFQLLGNIYDIWGKTDKAIDAYKRGLNRFPKSGKLYHELGIVEINRRKFDEGIAYFEKGMQADPGYATNYFDAAKIFAQSSEKIWAVFYAELFINLEPNTQRTVVMSQILYDTYIKAIQKKGSNLSVSFTKNTVLTTTDGKEIEKPFNTEFEMTMLTSALLVMLEKGDMDAEKITTVRNTFIKTWTEQGHDKKFPNLILTWQKELVDEGHFEAYSRWLISQGDTKSFEKWSKKNEKAFADFVSWFRDNPFPISETNMFYRGMYIKE